MPDDKKYLNHDEILDIIDTACKETLLASDLLDTDDHYKKDFDVDHGYEAYRILECTRDRLKALREKIKQFEIVKEEPKVPADKDD